jgi:hypothetical protein
VALTWSVTVGDGGLHNIAPCFLLTRQFTGPHMYSVRRSHAHFHIANLKDLGAFLLRLSGFAAAKGWVWGRQHTGMTHDGVDVRGVVAG